MGSFWEGREKEGRGGDGRDVGSRKSFLLQGIEYLERERWGRQRQRDSDRQRESKRGSSRQTEERHYDSWSRQWGSYWVLEHGTSDCWNCDSEQQILQISSETLTFDLGGLWEDISLSLFTLTQSSKGKDSLSPVSIPLLSQHGSFHSPCPMHPAVSVV